MIVDLEPYLGDAVREAPEPEPRRQDPPRHYICPNDEAMLRVRPRSIDQRNFSTRAMEKRYMGCGWSLLSPCGIGHRLPSLR